MHKLAQALKHSNGRLPKTRAEAEALPMIGQYIANAFELFVLKKPAPLLDVNMARVLERYFGPRKLADIRYDPYLQDLAQRVVEHHASIQLNWAVLDLGALVCKARSPNCVNCPLLAGCHYTKLHS